MVGGFAAGVFIGLAGLFTPALSFTWEIGLSASKAMSDASYMVDRGRGYTIYKETGFLGITTGYSVYEG
ncbi:MAG: hypothetical protein FWD76_00280 [Firmicutes bacterium]|nr:hypothetical protein [Bacillota bacterium]